MGKNNVGRRENAKPIKVKIKKVIPTTFPDEVIVTLEISGEQLTAIFPSSTVNTNAKTVDATVIERKGDLYLIELPTSTFTTGSKAWVPKALVATGL